MAEESKSEENKMQVDQVEGGNASRDPDLLNQSSIENTKEQDVEMETEQ